MKKLLALVCILLLFTSVCFAEAVDPLGRMEETVTLTTSRAMTETAVFDTNDPEKKNYQENRWTNAFLEYLNIDLDYTWIATDSDSDSTKWAAAIATGNVPDFAMVGDKTYKMLLESDLIMDCTEVWDSYASDGYKSLLPADAVAQMTYGGKLMGIPWPNKGYHGATMLFVRQDWLDKLGLSYPTTLDELVNVATAFRDAKLGGEETIGMMFSMGASDGKLDGFMNMFGAYKDYWLNIDGKVTWSNIQPEMKDALLALQKLYTDGVINSDFAVTTADLAKEYIAGGKTGVFFATSWNTTTSVQALYENDPNAAVVVRPIFGVNGEPVKFQTNTPRVGKIFVSKNCAHPDAVMKAVNLAYALTTDVEEYLRYGVDETGHMWFKYLPFGDSPKSTLNDLINAYEIEQAYLKVRSGELADGTAYPFTNADNVNRYNNYVNSIAGNTAAWYKLTYGIDGAYTQLYYAFQDGLQLSNAYMGLPTDTQSMLGDVINDALNTAMYEVIMGADIQVYESACQAWLTGGGQDIIDEINEALGL